MKFALLFSGGKDSVYSLYYYLSQGWECRYLVSFFSENPDSFMYHTSNIGMTAKLAAALGIELIVERTEGKKELELDSLRKGLEKIHDDVDAVVTGAIWSDYQESRVQEVCAGLGLKCFSPLWRKDQKKVLEYVVGAGFEVILTQTASGDLGKEWLGKRIDLESVAELASHYNPAGEGGEFETLVLGGPFFRKRVVLRDVKKRFEGGCGYLEIGKADLVENELLAKADK